MSRSPPRGIATSISPTARTSSVTAEWSSVSTSCTASPTPASRTAAASALFDSIASLPPRKITALPVLRQSAAVSMKTFGRDSKTTAITPNGTRTLRIFIPLGRSRVQIVSPTGSGRVATCRTPATIASNRAGVSVRRSSIEGEIPASFACAKSMPFAATIDARFFSRESAMARSAAFFSSVVFFASPAAAARAFVAISSIVSCTFICAWASRIA